MKQIDERSLIVVSGPSGCGKDTVIRELMRIDERVKLSVSCTTRAPREGEQEGVDYYFITEAEFKRRIEEGDILEYNFYAGNYYGTPVKELSDRLDGNTRIVLVIDVNGARNVKRVFPGALLVFVEPPSIEELKKRLSGRGTETEEQVNRRLEIAKGEMQQKTIYDKVVVNDSVEACALQLQSLINEWNKK